MIFNGRNRKKINLLLCLNFGLNKTNTKMARRQPIARKDHLENKGRKTGQGIEKPKELLRDDKKRKAEKQA
jgi:hypothetical protein